MTGPSDTSDKTQGNKASFHPAFGVNNIKNSIPLVLDQSDGHYASWVELFHIHACAYNVLDHVNPKAVRSTDVDEATWTRLDAIVKQWIYATISADLLQTIMKPGATAQELWNRLEEIFQDNKATRAVYLEEQFNTTRLDAFSNITDYCARLKNLADQLANVGNPISENKMVLQLVSGLTKGDYDTIATFIQQSDPLPSFNKARSQLLLEETRRTKQDSHTPQALVTQRSDAQAAAVDTSSARDPIARVNSRGGFRSGRGRHRGRGRGRYGYQQQFSWPPPNWYSGNPWKAPPCPYPTAQPHSQMSLLGPGPRPPQQQAQQQAHFTADPNIVHGAPMTPTALEHAFHTMHLQPPDNTWYMDTGSTSHVASNSGPYHGENNHEMQQFR